MDKIHRRIPLQHRNVRQPVVFAFNILLNHYLAFNTQHYHAVKNLFQGYNQLEDNFYLLPNVTNVSMSIEQRGALLAQNLAQLSKHHGFKSQAHLVTHSFCGVDARAALSMYGASAHVRSLTTVCSPHRGMRLMDNYSTMPERFLIEDSEKAFEAVGVSQKAAQEFTTENIGDFNKIAEDVAGVDYFSIGAHKERLQCSDLLR